MNKEMMGRIMEARKYQKMAVKALLPEEMADHVEVIEKELTEMFFSCAMEFMREKNRKDTQNSTKTDCDTSGTKKTGSDKSDRVKKVNID